MAPAVIVVVAAEVGTIASAMIGVDAMAVAGKAVAATMTALTTRRSAAATRLRSMGLMTDRAMIAAARGAAEMTALETTAVVGAERHPCHHESPGSCWGSPSDHRQRGIIAHVPDLHCPVAMQLIAWLPLRHSFVQDVTASTSVRRPKALGPIGEPHECGG
jgi:hypothetical protein